MVQENIYWQLFQVAIVMKHRLMTIAEANGLTVMQLYTLSLLETNRSIPMNSLSSLLYCDASNVTGIVDRLLHQGYIKREENPKDRREKIITLTANGAALCAKISAVLPNRLEQLSADEQQKLQTILTTLIPQL